jgi:ribosomal protein S18 acetylase RimI-like enzyme
VGYYLHRTDADDVEHTISTGLPFRRGARQGIGRQLLEHAEREISASGAASVIARNLVAPK